MRNVESWVPTKFELFDDGWGPSRDPKELALSSRFMAGRAIRSYTKAIQEHATGHLADLGCGKAPLYGAYRALVDEVTCIDWPGSAHGTSHIDVFADLNEPIDLPDSQFDTILSTSVLEHIWRHDVMWTEMARLLRPKGKLILGVPFSYQLHERPYDFFRWTAHALERACQETKLELVSLETYGGPLDAIADNLLKVIAHRTTLTRIANKCAEVMLTKGPLRRMSDSRSQAMPLGYVIVAQKA